VTSATTTEPDARVDRAVLRRLLDGEHAETRDLVRGWLSEPGNAPRPDLPMSEHRAQVLAWAQALAADGRTALGFPKEYGGEGAVGASVAAFETLAFGDLSLLVKLGVQFGLFGGAVLHLGTRRHHERYLADIAALRLPGCFAMTETGHGSNVQALETTATYDTATQEFVVHTPHEAARKDYIGNAARDGRMAAVFAQLIVGGEMRGVHALLVPLRDEAGTVLDGIRIEDCGAKLGLDGVDNGRIWFHEERVPRDALLDRYATVSSDGVYHSTIENPTKRFFVMLGTLIQGSARARDDGGRAEGDRDLARDGDHPGVPRGVRRRRVPQRQPLRRAEGRHRRVHDLRGRQHRPHAARGEEPADRHARPARRARPARHGELLRRPGDRHHRRAHGHPRAAGPHRRRAAAGRPRRR
jgi:hypothetical protein